MKRIIVIATSVALIAVAAVTVVAPAQADASTRCSGSASFYTNGGDSGLVSSYRGNGMACSSVRYAARRLANRISRQWGWPTANVSFHDGYVRWHCTQYGYGGFRVACHEYSSGTSFQTRIGVWYH